MTARRPAWSALRSGRRLLLVTPVLLAGAAAVVAVARWPAAAPQRAARVRALTDRLAARLLRALGVRVERVGRPPGGAALLTANHLSWLDVLVLRVAVPEAVPVAKREVGTWPVIGAVARAGETILVDRTRRRDLLRVVRAMRAHFSADRSVLLFAEGTTSDGAGVLPFRSALFDAAVCEGVPVVPVTLQPDTGPGGPSVREHVCWWGDAALLPHILRLAGVAHTRVVVRLGEPIPLDALPSLAPFACRALRRARRRGASTVARSRVARRFRPLT